PIPLSDSSAEAYGSGDRLGLDFPTRSSFERHAIAQLELQVLEHGAEIVQCNMVIDFLQGRVHELRADLDDAMAHIGMLHEQPIPPVVPAEPAAAEDPEEIEGVSDIDSEHALAEPNPQPDDSP